MPRKPQKNDPLIEVIEEFVRAVTGIALQNMKGDLEAQVRDALLNDQIADAAPNAQPKRKRKPKRAPTPSEVPMSRLVQMTGIDQGNLRRYCLSLGIYQCDDSTPAHVLAKDVPYLLQHLRDHSSVYRRNSKERAAQQVTP